MSYGIIFALISMFGYGIGNAMTKMPTEKIGSLLTIVFRGLFNSLFLFVAFLLFSDKFVFSLRDILIAVSISIISYLPLLFFIKALKTGKIGMVSPVANSSAASTVLFSFIFFRESLSLNQLGALIIILLGIIFVSINFKDFKNSELFNTSSGLPYALMAMLLWGLVFALFKIPVQTLGPLLTSFIIEFMVFILAIAHSKASKTSFLVPDKKILLTIFCLAFFSSLGTLFYNLGIKITSVGVVSAIVSSSPLVIILYGKIVYQEKLKAQQYLAIVLILVGVVMMSVL